MIEVYKWLYFVLVKGIYSSEVDNLMNLFKVLFEFKLFDDEFKFVW